MAVDAKLRGAPAPKPKRKPKASPGFTRAQRAPAKIINALARVQNAGARDQLKTAAAKKGPPTPVRQRPADTERNKHYQTARGFRPTAEVKLQRQTTKDVKTLFNPKASTRRQSQAVVRLRRSGLVGTQINPYVAKPTPGTSVALTRLRGVSASGASSIKLPRYTKGSPTKPGLIPAVLKGLTHNRYAVNTVPSTKGMGLSIGNPANGIIGGVGKPLGVLGQALDRPVGSALSIEAKALLAAGVVDRKSKLGKKIAKARGPLQVLLHGRRMGKDVSGGDLVQAVHLPRQLGLPAEIATDPVMWAGVAALPETGGASAGLVADRLAMRIGKEAPELLRTVRIRDLQSAAHASGDYGPLTNALKDIAKARGIQTTRLLSRSDKRIVAGKQATRTQKALAQIRSNKAEVDQRIGLIPARTRKLLPNKAARTGYVPDEPAITAAKSVAQLAKNRELAPGARLKLMTPLGRTLGTVDVPIPKRLANLKVLPVGKNAKLELRAQAMEHAAATVTQEEHTALQSVDKLLGQMRRDGNVEEFNKLQKRRAQLVEHYASQRNLAMQDAVKQIDNRSSQSLVEKVSRGNTRRLQRELSPLTNQLGRNVQQQFEGQVLEATSRLKGTPAEVKRSLNRIQLAMWARADTGSESVIKAAVKLTPEERAVERELRQVYERMGTFDVKMGMLEPNQVLKDYGGPRIWMHQGQTEPTVDEVVRNFSRRLGGGSFFARHRAHPSVADLADPELLAQALRDHADVQGLTPTLSREIVDRWHRVTTPRMTAELLARQLQRGNTGKLLEDLTPSFRRGANYGAHMTPRGEPVEVPLFKNPNDLSSEGRVALDTSGKAQRTYGFTEDPFAGLVGGQELQARYRAIDNERKDIIQFLKTTKSGTPQFRDLKKHLKGLDKEQAAARSELTDTYITQMEHRIEELKGQQNQLNMELLHHQLSDGPLDPATMKSLANTMSELNLLDAKLRGQEAFLQEFRAQREGRKAADDAISKIDELRAEVERQHAEDQRLLNEQNLGHVHNAIDQILGGQRERSLFNLPQRPSELSTSVDFRTRLSSQAWADHLRQMEYNDRVPVPGFERIGLQIERKRNNRFNIYSEHGVVYPELTPDQASELLHEMQARHLADQRETYLRPDDPVARDPFDWQSYLPDFREHKMFPLMDPRESNFYRTRSEGVEAAYVLRWKAIDHAEGRDVSEATAQYIGPNGERGVANELVPYGYDEQRGVMLQDAKTGEVHAADDLQFPEPTLIPNSSHTIFYDPVTKREFVFPRQASAIGDSIARRISEDRLWPSEVLRAAEAEAVRAGEYNIVYKTGVEAGVGKVLALMRYSVTTPFPAYHIRNVMSDALKSLQADPGVLFHPIMNARLTAIAAGAKKSGVIKVPHLGELSIEDFLLMADTFGIRSGHHLAEVARISERANYDAARWRQFVSSVGPNGAVGKRLVDFGVRREDTVRFMTFMQRMRRNGGDAADAMWYMIRHHFDYNDLSAAERRYFRNLFLFYTWYRKNIPLQLMEIVRRPAFFAAVAHTYNESMQGETPANFNWSKLNPMFPDLSGKMPTRLQPPDYYWNRLSGFPISWNGHAAMFGFGAPWADLSLLEPTQEGLRNVVSMMNPAASLTYQVASGTDVLTGRKFKNEEPSGLAGVLGHLGLPLLKDDKGRDTLPWALGLALQNVVPGFGRAFGSFQPNSPARDSGRLSSYGKILNNVTGINAYVGPKPHSAREGYALSRLAAARAAQRGDFLESISNLKDKSPKAYKARVAAFDKATLQWAKDRGLPKEYLAKVKQTGFYERKRRRPPAPPQTLSGGGLSGGLSSGGLK